MMCASLFYPPHFIDIICQSRQRLTVTKILENIVSLMREAYLLLVDIPQPYLILCIVYVLPKFVLHDILCSCILSAFGCTAFGIYIKIH